MHIKRRRRDDDDDDEMSALHEFNAMMISTMMWSLYVCVWFVQCALIIDDDNGNGASD